MYLSSFQNSYMRILYIYRHPDMGYSIGKVFRPIEEEMKKNAEVDSLYLPVPNYSLKGLYCNIRAARTAVKRRHYDIVHITGSEHYLIPFLSGCRVVVTVHDLGFCTILKHKATYKIKYALFVTSLKKASFVTFISNKSEKETLERVNLRRGRYTTIYNAVGKEFVEYIKPFNKTIPTILHIGTSVHKNLDRTIEALKGIPCVLKIIGNVSDSQKYRMDEIGIKYSIASNLTDEAILEEYRKADIISFPSLYEGFGMPIIEGQAIGRIVVTSDLEPMRTVAGEGGAIFVNPYSLYSLHQAYLAAILDDDLRDKIIRNGLKNVNRFNLSKIANMYYIIYKSLISSR